MIRYLACADCGIKRKSMYEDKLTTRRYAMRKRFGVVRELAIPFVRPNEDSLIDQNARNYVCDFCSADLTPGLPVVCISQWEKAVSPPEPPAWEHEYMISITAHCSIEWAELVEHFRAVRARLKLAV